MRTEVAGVRQPKASNLADAFRSLCLSEKLSDITFVVDGKKIPAHKIVLASRSSVFEKIISDCASIPHPQIKIVEPVTTAELFTDFLTLFYENPVMLDVDKTIGILHLAQFYDMVEIVHTCTDFLAKNVTPENALYIGEAIYRYADELWDFFEGYITENSGAVLQSQLLPQIGACFLAKVLTFDLLLPEHEIFELLLPWFDAHTDEAERQTVLKKISFPTMSTYFLATTVYPKKLLTDKQYLTALHASASFQVDAQSEFPIRKQREKVLFRHIDGYHTVVDGDSRLCDAFDENPQLARGAWTVNIEFPKSKLIVGRFESNTWFESCVYARPCPDGILFEVRKAAASSDSVLIAKFHDCE
uniref:BTB domain-containing protein n=1 Tax=Panagrellus redivivus TaxID=6233 RepID=A0A7E4ZYM3_PANRE